ncbi:MAG TPA: TlpA disulfide reductase family protein [Polyangiaceae bacterium]|nr:TlpA disulfide reductase family protein [Polyangiaceae bacterium]
MNARLSRLLDYALYGALGVTLVTFVSRKMSGPTEGKTAAPIDLPLLGEEKRFKLAEHANRPVLLEVFASWCGVCERTAPSVGAAFAKHSKSGVTFLGVSVDSNPADAARAKQSWPIPYDVALDDGSLSRAYDIKVLPTFVLIGADGRVKHVSTGAASESTLESWLSDAR